MKNIPHASKAQLKYYHSLTLKKYRDQERKFIIEGARLVEEALKAAFPIEAILVIRQFIEKPENAPIIRAIEKSRYTLLELSESDLSKISDTVTSQGIIAIANQPEISDASFWKKLPDRSIIVALDNISDPGNLGTILRTCDWFGVDGVFIGTDTVELYNPKVVRSTMGAIFHLPIFPESELSSILTEAKKHGIAIIATTLEGENVYQYSFPQKSILIFGSEAHGVKKELLEQADMKLTIPKFGRAESLNVASAAAVTLALMRK